jgi:transposase
MSSMTGETGVVVGGVDTHNQTHHVAVIDQLGREVSDREFPATAVGYAALARWLRSFGELVRVGVEGTSSYGAGLARYLRQVGVSVLEINRRTGGLVARRASLTRSMPMPRPGPP